MSMSRCSSMVLTVKGRVGFVEDGSTLAFPAHADDVRRVPATRAFGMERVDRASLERADGIFHETAFVQRVRMNGNLHIEFVRHAQAAVDGSGRRAPILVQFQARRPRRGLARAMVRAWSNCPCRKSRGSSDIRRRLRASGGGSRCRACRWWRRCRGPGRCRHRSWWSRRWPARGRSAAGR